MKYLKKINRYVKTQIFTYYILHNYVTVPTCNNTKVNRLFMIYLLHPVYRPNLLHIPIVLAIPVALEAYVDRKGEKVVDKDEYCNYCSKHIVLIAKLLFLRGRPT